MLGVTLSFGEVVYSETVLGYQRKRLQDHQMIDFQALEMPTVEFPTRALWYELDELIASEPFPESISSARCTRSSTVRSRCCR